MSSGGQYHWVSEFAPPSCQKFLSYITGWVSTLSWQAGNASGGFLCGTLIQSLIIIKNPDYAAPGWQGTLLVFPVMLVCVCFNVWFNHWLPSMQNAVMVLHVAGFLAIMIVFWVLSPHVPAREVFLDFENGGGWQTMGLALMIGQVSAVGFLGASDAAAHMSEEVKDAGLSVPRAMVSIESLASCSLQSLTCIQVVDLHCERSPWSDHARVIPLCYAIG